MFRLIFIRTKLNMGLRESLFWILKIIYIKTDEKQQKGNVLYK